MTDQFIPKSTVDDVLFYVVALTIVLAARRDQGI